MTDYLEELLDEEEQENERGLQWTRVVRAGLADVRVVPESGMDAQAARQQTWTEAQQSRTEAQRSRQEARQSRQDAGYAIAWEMERLGRAVVRAHTRGQERAGEWRGGVGLPAAQYVPGAGAAVRMGTVAVDYAGLVDAAFERDARRYDGPLSLL